MALTHTNMPLAYQEQIFNMTNEEKLNLVEFILHSMHQTTDEDKHREDIAMNHELDSIAFGSIHLPDDFDYDRELTNALNEKYGL